VPLNLALTSTVLMIAYQLQLPLPPPQLVRTRQRLPMTRSAAPAMIDCSVLQTMIQRLCLNATSCATMILTAASFPWAKMPLVIFRGFALDAKVVRVLRIRMASICMLWMVIASPVPQVLLLQLHSQLHPLLQIPQPVQRILLSAVFLRVLWHPTKNAALGQKEHSVLKMVIQCHWKNATLCVWQTQHV